MITTLYKNDLCAANGGQEKRLFQQTARSTGVSLAQFLREAAREKTLPLKREPACFKYMDEIETPAEAMKNPKASIRKTILEKHAGHR